MYRYVTQCCCPGLSIWSKLFLTSTQFLFNLYASTKYDGCDILYFTMRFLNGYIKCQKSDRTFVTLHSRRNCWNTLLPTSKSGIYYSTNHTSELIYFDQSSTHKKSMEMRLFPSDSSNLPTLFEGILPLLLTRSHDHISF